MTRVPILTASVGEGHDLPARTLSDQLRAEDPSVDVVVEDGLRAMGRGFVLDQRTGTRRRLLPLPLALGRRVLAVRRARADARGRRRRSCASSARAACSGS